MNAHEILKQLRAQKQHWWKKALLSNVDYDYGSVDDQLWQEHAFHPGKRDGNWVTVHKIPGSKKLQYEVLTAKGRSAFQYRTFQGLPGSWTSRFHLDKEYEDLIFSKREDLGL